DVHVINGVGTPVSVRQVDEPFQGAMCDSVGNLIACGHPASLAVPIGKRLVIEYVSGNCAVATGSLLNLSLKTFLGGSLGFHMLNLAPFSSSQGAANYGHVTRIYADPASTVTVELAGENFPNAACNVFVSGSLVDAP